jgi:malonyl-CoA/methylmalonyl-CoA synthetase
VAAIVVLNPDAGTGRGGKQWGAMDMRRALKDRLANYKIPQELKIVESIPRNAMGKSKRCSPTSMCPITNDVKSTKSY